MNIFFYQIKENIFDIFRNKNLYAHIFAVIFTALLVFSGFDWWYFRQVNGSTISSYLWPAVILGGIIPLLAPILLFLFGIFKKNSIVVNTGFALAQSAFLGLLISSTYKAFTGRIPPMHLMVSVASDVSYGFQFGFMRGGVFWGWPSSHTTIAFATMFTLITLYPKNTLLKVIALFYALYVGFGVSVGIHWFSEFIAGMLIGAVIGVVVGKAFAERMHLLTSEKNTPVTILSSEQF